jgi:hypothetical protein
LLRRQERAPRNDNATAVLPLAAMAYVPFLVYNVKKTMRHDRYLPDPCLILVFYGSEAM